MSYSITIFCPDRHLIYDGNTPYQHGVGGGITSRVRMAKALAAAGHKVVAVVNCRDEKVIDGVQYLPLDSVSELAGDILITNTSGGDYSLAPLAEHRRDFGLHIVWVSGTQIPGGLGEVTFDFLYAKSNFLRNIIIREWGIQGSKIFVSYNPVDESLFSPTANQRDRYRLVYCSHPSKGLVSALLLLDRLKKEEPRYHLEVYGGPALWGEEQKLPENSDGVAYFGLVSQVDLAQVLQRSGFSICLQTREEPFGMVVTESMLAGCVVLASDVGAYPELVRHGQNGFIIEGDPDSEAAQKAAAEIILGLSSSEVAFQRVSSLARQMPWTSRRMIEVWQDHWQWYFSNASLKNTGAGSADAHSSGTHRGLVLDDGFHCLDCGVYEPETVLSSARHSIVGPW